MVEQDVVIIRYLDDSGKPDLARLQRAVENGYVLVKFTNTKGGTELGANTKNEDPSCSATIDTANNVIRVKFVLELLPSTLPNVSVLFRLCRGRLKLDYCPVRLEATVALDTFKGKGKLLVIDNFESKKFN